MKKSLFFFAIALLVGFCFVAFAETVIPLVDEDGTPLFVRHISVVDNTAYFLLKGEQMCIVNVEDEIEVIPVVNENPEYEEVSQALLERHGIPDGMEAPEWYAQFAQGINRVIGDGNALYALNDFTGTLYRVLLSDTQATLQALCVLDFVFDNMSGDDVYVTQALIVNEELYVILNETMYCFDKETGARSSAKAYSLLDMLPYRKGQMLLLEEINAFDRAVYTYEPSTNARTKIDTGAIKEIDQIFYDKANDRIILYSDSKIIALMDSGAQMTVGYWPSQDYGVTLMVLDHGKMAVFDGNLRIMDISEQAPPQMMLIVASSYLSFDEYDFVNQHPEVLFSRNVMSPDEILEMFSTQMTIRSSEYDVFEIPVGPSLDNILEKGFYVPLEASPEVMDLLQTLHPFIAEKILQDGHIGALPVHLGNQTASYSQYALAQLGIDPNEMPKSYAEFLEFCLAFDEKYGDVARNKGITLFADSLLTAGYSVADSLFTISFSLAEQITQCYYKLICSDAQLALDKEAELAALFDMLKSLRNMKQAETLVGEAYEPPTRDGHNPPMRYRANAEPNYLFTVTGSVLPDSRHYSVRELVNDFIPTPLSLFEGMKPQLVLTGGALIINPYSANMEDAETFITYYAANFPGAKATALFTDAQPVEERDYGMLKRMYASAIEEFNERLKFTQDEAEKKEIQYQIEINQKELAAVDAVKWAVRQEWIDDYHRMLKQTEIVWQDDLVLGISTRTLLWQLLQGTTMDGNTCAKEMIELFQKAISENAK